ncbi:acyl carrier protein [Streptomyces sp. SCSIO ZS0520]|uniref:acyl carrier protein n=1 Tax=Streptomyces sp. SCSIO ZS0520 TaxID=2892996 RepID=UPI0021DAD2A9|nr:acyl carrier protein [Streptomyces sp. SCSIO ZS0520]
MAQDPSEGVSESISAFIKERFLDGDPKGELEETTPLLEWGVLNSLNTVLLLNHIRGEFGVTVPPARLNARDLKNVRTITAMVRDMTAGKGA